MFFYGVLAGAGLLALFQNLFDYRIDEEVIEYVFDPIKTFFLRLFGKNARARIELRAKAAVHDAYAELVNLQKTAAGDVSKVEGELKRIAERIKEAL